MTQTLDRPKPVNPHKTASEIVRDYQLHHGESMPVVDLAKEFPRVAEALGVTVRLAMADQTASGTFKTRGMGVAMLRAYQRNITDFIVPSAGNAWRGALAFGRYLSEAHGADLNLHAVMPASAPPAKRYAHHELWPEGKIQVTIHGQTFQEANAKANQLRHQTGAYLLHPYDDMDVIEGQGTIVDDILRADRVFPDQIIAPTGGGGLISGIVKRSVELQLSPLEIIAVEATGSNGLSRSWQAGQLMEAPAPNTRYGGAAVNHIGRKALTTLQKTLKSDSQRGLTILTVDDERVQEVARAYDLDRKENNFSNAGYEPTSLLAVAAILKLADMGRLKSNAVVIGTGRNAPYEPLLLPQSYRKSVRGWRGAQLSSKNQ